MGILGGSDIDRIKEEAINPLSEKVDNLVGTALNSTIGTPDFTPLDQMIVSIENKLKLNTFLGKWDNVLTKCAIASGSYTIPKDGTWRITACGQGGTYVGNTFRGGGGCAIDERVYQKGDVITLTVSGTASAVCSPRGLSITALGTTTTTGGTASGGNVGNYTGGNGVSNTGTGGSSLGCGGAGTTGGTGGIIGGTGFSGGAGAGGYIGGNSGSFAYNGGTGGILGGTASGTGGASNGGNGGAGGYIGGNGGATTTSFAGSGGSGGVLGGNGGLASSATGLNGTGGNGGGVYSRSINGGFTGEYWRIPFMPEITRWTFGNAIIFIEEVLA